MLRSQVKRSYKILAVGSVAAAIGIAAVSGTAMACGWGDHDGRHGKKAYMKEMFERADTDKNGSVSMVELASLKDSLFQGADSNRDSGINAEEFQYLLLEAMGPVVDGQFQKLDDDGDGVVTIVELSKPIDHAASRLDRNDDGEITEKELRRKHWFHDDDDDDDGWF